MLIDWFTVGAQTLNFLILVWLMKRFLYKPILQAIDARERKIAAELEDADTKKAEAQKERDEFQQRNETFDRERAALMSKATDEVEAKRQLLLDEARKDADTMRTKRQEALRNERNTLNRDIVRWTQKEVFAIARKTLADLATKSLETCMAGIFIHRLRALAGADKEQLALALKTSTLSAQVRSAFDLSPEQQAAIQNAVDETFSVAIQIQFASVPELVSGIELSCNGQKVAWSIAEYLATLEKSAAELLKDAERPEPKPDTNSKPPEPGAKAEPCGRLNTDSNQVSRVQG